MSRWGAKEGAREKDEVRGHTVEGMGLWPSKEMDPISVHCSVEFPLLGEESAVGNLIGWPPRFSFNIGPKPAVTPASRVGLEHAQGGPEQESTASWSTGALEPSAAAESGLPRPPWHAT